MLERPRINLKFWEGSGELQLLGQACDKWWDKVQGWLEWAAVQIDPETAPLILVDILAWQRDIERFAGESDHIYRLRVKYALANAKDAGYKAGWERIWNRLELGNLVQEERIDSVEWDVISLIMTEKQVAEDSDLMNVLIRQYGRTCRRYALGTKTNLTVSCRAFTWHEETEQMINFNRENNDMASKIRPSGYEIQTEFIAARN